MYTFAEIDVNNKVVGVVRSPTYLISDSLIETENLLDLVNNRGVEYIYDKDSKEFTEVVNVSALKVTLWDGIKSRRDQLEFGGFEFEGNMYDSDQVSQGRIMGAALAGLDQVWTLADNSTVSLTGTKLKELYQALQAHIAEVHERGRIARQAIESAVTKEEVEAIHL